MKLSLGLSPRDYSVAGGAVAYDTDAQAYFTANTAITSSADKNAINTFYLGLKSDGIYTKIKAMYLPIWGSAASCKWNLKDPRDLDAAYRLTFTTGWTYASSGITPTNAYANTQLTFNTMSLSSHHLSYYSQTNILSQSTFEMGVSDNASNASAIIMSYSSGLGSLSRIAQSFSTIYTPTKSNIFQIASSNSSNNTRLFENGIYKGQNTGTQTTLGIRYYYIGAVNATATNVNNGTASFYTTKKLSFCSIGDGLTDTEASNLSNRVNTLMAYFGINTYPVVSDSDAQAYINANDAITSQSDANAINTFFTGLKSDGVYSKIKAMYLPIWGSASSSKWNLVNPADTNAAYRLTFATGMTFTSGGMTSNGTSGYANTNYNPNANGQLNSAHLSFYSRTDNNLNQAEIGAGAGADYHLLQIRVTNIFYSLINQSALTSVSNTNSLGFHLGNRQLSNDTDIWKNGTKLLNGTTASTSNLNTNLFICCYSNSGAPSSYSTKQCSFASIGTGLTDAEASNFYTRVNTLMTYFGINV